VSEHLHRGVSFYIMIPMEAVVCLCSRAVGMTLLVLDVPETLVCSQ
jgi:hypothetical protein